MTNAASKLVGFKDLQPEPCDGTGNDAMAKRFHKWHRNVPLEEVILDPTQPIDLAALVPVPCSECPNDPITKRMLAKWKPRASTAPKTATAVQAAKPAAPVAQTDDVQPDVERQVDENNNECMPADKAQDAEAKPSPRPSGDKIYSYDSFMFRSYPLCKAEFRTGLGAAYAKMITAPPRVGGGLQRGPGGPPRGPGGPPRGPGGPPRGPGGPPRGQGGPPRGQYRR